MPHTRLCRVFVVKRCCAEVDPDENALQAAMLLFDDVRMQMRMFTHEPSIEFSDRIPSARPRPADENMALNPTHSRFSYLEGVQQQH